MTGASEEGLRELRESHKILGGAPLDRIEALVADPVPGSADDIDFEAVEASLREGFRFAFRDTFERRLDANLRMHRELHRSPRDRGIEVCVAGLRQARDFAKASGRMTKTDWVDTWVPTDFGAALADLPATKPGGALVETLADLLAASEQLVDSAVAARRCSEEIRCPVARAELEAAAMIKIRKRNLGRKIEVRIEVDSDQAHDYAIPR